MTLPRSIPLTQLIVGTIVVITIIVALIVAIRWFGKTNNVKRNKERN